MPFSFTWTNVDPADPTAANLLGKDIRDLRGAIQERMDANFCDASGPWLTSDPTHPIVPAATITGKDATKVRIIHHTKFIQIANANFAIRYSDLYMDASAGGGGGSMTAYCSVEFGQPTVSAAGVTISNFDMIVDPLSLGAITLTLQRNVYSATPSVTIIGTATSTNTTGVALFASAAINEVVAGQDYYFKIVMPGPAFVCGRLYGVRLNLNVPFDARSALV